MNGKKSIMGAAAALALLLALASASAAPNAYPSKPITFVVQASPGGGSDLFARAIAAGIEQNKLLPQPVAVENKPGANGAIAFAYVAAKKGDPYYILNASASFITTPVMGQSKVGYKDFTPIANLAYDEFMLFVSANSKFKTMKDLVDAAKANPKGVNVGGTQLGASDSICIYLVEKAAGVKFNYITFPGGAEVNTAVLGNNVDFGVGNPGDILELAKAGKVRVLGVFSEKRLAGAPEVPTMKEQGINAVFMQNRGVVAPLGIADAERKTLEAALLKFAKSDYWKAYLKTNMMSEAWLDGPGFNKFLEEWTGKYTAILKEMGVVK